MFGLARKEQQGRHQKQQEHQHWEQGPQQSIMLGRPEQNKNNVHTYIHTYRTEQDNRHTDRHTSYLLRPNRTRTTTRTELSPTGQGPVGLSPIRHVKAVSHKLVHRHSTAHHITAGWGLKMGAASGCGPFCLVP